MATLKQKKAIALLVENGGNVSRAMREAGYSPNTAKNPNKLTDSISYREEVAPLVARMEEERDRILEALPMKRKDAKYRDLVDGVDKLTKNIQLLTGGDTGKEKITFGWQE